MKTNVNCCEFGEHTGCIDDAGGSKCSPLTLAANSRYRSGGLEVMRILLSALADPDVGDTSTGSTPLHVVCCDEHEEHLAMMELLMAYGADRNRGDINGLRPVHVTAIHSTEECLRALAAGGGLDVNAIVTAGWFKGYTALDMALTHFPIAEPGMVRLLRDELGALTAKAVRRRRMCRLAIRVLLQYKLHRRAKEWLVQRYEAAKARVEFAPGGAGAARAAASFASAVERPSKRARTN